MSRPRVRLRDGSSWFEYAADGAVTLVVYRRVTRAEGTWLELRFTASSEEGAERLYDAYCRESYRRAVEQAERRARWGPV